MSCNCVYVCRQTNQEKLAPLANLGMMMNIFSQMNMKTHQSTNQSESQKHKADQETIQQPLKHDSNPPSEPLKESKTLVPEPPSKPLAHEDINQGQQSDSVAQGDANSKQDTVLGYVSSSLEDRLNQQLQSMQRSLLESMHQMIAESEQRICNKMEQLLSNYKTTSTPQLELD